MRWTNANISCTIPSELYGLVHYAPQLFLCFTEAKKLIKQKIPYVVVVLSY